VSTISVHYVLPKRNVLIRRFTDNKTRERGVPTALLFSEMTGHILKQCVTKEDGNNDFLNTTANGAASLIRQAPIPPPISNFASQHLVSRLIFNELARTQHR
jgi:hypothetical protein